MAYCNKCGTQIEDSAKFCPKCGNSIREDIVNVSQSGSHSNNSDEMSKGQKSGAGCATIIALACIMGGLSEGNVFIVIASIAAIGAMIYLFMGKIDKKYTWATIIAAILGVFVVVGATHEETQSTEQVKSEQKEESKTDTKVQQSKEQIAKNNVESAESKKQEEIHHDFFENGYKYSTSFRVNRKQGWGISCSYKYIIKIYNDGTKEISSANQTDDGSPVPQGTHTCTIDKKSESYRDVYATWYEVKFKYGYSYGNKYHTSEDKIYVDESGNVIMLGENGNNKNIYEAISTKDCIFGKFSKEKLTKEVYKCRTCGEEFDPGKEAIYSEDYCYVDYPQTCKYCGKSFTVRNEGSGACKEVCAACYHRRQSVKIYEDATGKKIY